MLRDFKHGKKIKTKMQQQNKMHKYLLKYQKNAQNHFSRPRIFQFPFEKPPFFGNSGAACIFKIFQYRSEATITKFYFRLIRILSKKSVSKKRKFSETFAFKLSQKSCKIVFDSVRFFLFPERENGRVFSYFPTQIACKERQPSKLNL